MDANAFTLMRCLSDGRFHSGEELAKKLGGRRTLLCQAVRSLQRDLGITVSGVPGKGYRLVAPFEWLDVETIRDGLNKVAASTFTLAVEEHTDSTNTRLLRMADSPGLHGLVLATELQTAGRGRRGRQWQARLGTGLTFSLLWRFKRDLTHLTALPLTVGVALARTLRKLGAPVTLKWPNDVLLHERKLAGILIELAGDGLVTTTGVIGIGINLKDPGGVDQPVACLAEAGIKLTRSALLSALLNELHRALCDFDHLGFTPFRQEWTSLSAHHNAPVCLSLPHGDLVQGVSRGLTGNGALLLDTEDGRRTYHAGEVTLRKLRCSS